MFLLGAAAVAPCDSAAPVPTETSSRFLSPVFQFSRYAGSVAMRYNRNAGLLYGVTPPSTKTNVPEGFEGFHCRVSGGKYTGAAVLARTSCQSGIFRLQSWRARSLY